jgi:hypothetical protein
MRSSSVLKCLAVLVLFTSMKAATGQNAVSDWDAIALNTIVVSAGKSPAVAPVYFAYVDVAMYDAANSIDHRFTSFAVRVKPHRGASVDAAVVAAAHDVLSHYFPSQAAALDAAEANSLAVIGNSQSELDGVSVGQAIAAQWIALRTGDGLEAPITFVWGHGPGIWEPVPPFPPPAAPWMAQFTPFTFEVASQFLPVIEPPLPLNSKEWAEDFNITKTYGALNSTVRSPAQTEIGLFWADHTAAQYSRALRALIAQQHLGTADAARLAAMSNIALADSLVACMNAKYHYAFWRPYTAIHDADTDSNPETVADATWLPLDVTPGHPEYPANHGCATQALMMTLRDFFHRDKIPYTVTSNVTKTTHNFTRFSDVVLEVDAARIYGGLHFRHSVLQGNELGREVTRHMLEHDFKPSKDDSADDNQEEGDRH